MKCAICKKQFKDGDKLLGVYQYSGTLQTGFVRLNPEEYIHLTHAMQASQLAGKRVTNV